MMRASAGPESLGRTVGSAGNDEGRTSAPVVVAGSPLRRRREQIWFYVAAPRAGQPQFFTFDTCKPLRFQVGDVVPLMRDAADHVMFGPKMTLQDIPLVFGGTSALLFLAFFAMGTARHFILRRWRSRRMQRLE